MQPKTSESDPFDLGFDADDEFTSARAQDEAWPGEPFQAMTTGAVHPDPFVGLPMSADSPDDETGETTGANLSPADAFASLHRAVEAAEVPGLDVADADPVPA